MAALVLVSVALLGPLVAAGQGVSGCTNQTIRLVEASDRVEYCLNGVWRRLCRGGGFWQAREAFVTCRQLGYEGGRQGGTCDESVPMPFFRLARNCNGTENSIEECGGVVKNDSCPCGADKNQHGTLVCAQAQCADNEVRLVGGSSIREGRVEVCMNGRWGTVCNNSQEGIAGAVCSKLGFPPTGAEAVPTFFTAGAPIHNCTVLHGDTLNCTPITKRSCNHTMDLWVQCKSYNDVIRMVINDTLEMCCNTTQPSASPSTMCQTCPATEPTDWIQIDPTQTNNQECDTSTTTALGVVIVVLVALLAVTLIILSLLAIHRKHSAKNHTKKESTDKHETFHATIAEPSTTRNKSYSLHLLDAPHATPTQPEHSSMGPQYDTAVTCNEGLDTYDAIDRNINTPQDQPVSPAPVRDETNKKEDEFFDVEEHTYSAVNMTRKKRARAKNSKHDE